MGYVTKWVIIEEFSIFLNHRIVSEKWVGMLRIIQFGLIHSVLFEDRLNFIQFLIFAIGNTSFSLTYIMAFICLSFRRNY